MVIPILAIFVIVSLEGCSVAQDWLKGSAVHSDSVFSYPTSLDRVQIGATTKSDIQNLFGRPTDIQRSSDHQQPSESWSYSKAHHAIHYSMFLVLGCSRSLNKSISRPSPLAFLPMELLME